MKIARPKSPPIDAAAVQLRAELARKITARLPNEGKVTTAIPSLSLYRRNTPTDCMAVNYEPELVVFVQGEKRINVGGTIHICDESTILLTSIDLPVVSQVTQASKEKPILGMVLKLEMATVREILSQDEFHTPEAPSAARGMAVGVTTVDFLSACARLIDLLDTPRDVPFLSTLMHREILYRLLRGPLGKHLRAIATLGEQSNRTAKAVT